MRLIGINIRHYWGTLLYTLIVLVLCLIPASEMKVGVTISDKVAHVLMFLGLSLLLWVEYIFHYTYRRREHPIRWQGQLLYPLFIGAVTELLQHYVIPSRTGDIYDFFADTLGILLGMLVGFVVCLYIKKNIQNKVN